MSNKIALIFLAIVVFIGLMFGITICYDLYNVWGSGQTGKAQLMQADWNRQIAIREAEAKRESAKALAQAEIERAKGVAQANKIIGDSLKDNEQYLRYLWIDSLQSTQNQIIYVPTESNLPILEASRLKPTTEKTK
jgi:regulator of protease activity HflC (stomatin/prohibitin superfamily)